MRNNEETSEIEARDGCPECDGDLGREVGTNTRGICLDCGWTGNLYTVSEDE